MTLERLRGSEGAERWEELARLRIAVFREFPYLYEGSLEYEKSYLEPYWRSPRSLVVLVRDGEETVGATTALPMVDEDETLHVEHPERYLYLGESLLLPAWRGRGLGRTFFDEREAHARSLGFEQAGFFAVVRPEDHPRRPAGYRPLHDFWEGRGYRPQPGVTRTFSWKDLDETEASPKPMQFWARTWRNG